MNASLDELRPSPIGTAHKTYLPYWRRRCGFAEWSKIRSDQIIRFVSLCSILISVNSASGQTWRWAKKASRGTGDLFSTYNSGLGVAADNSGNIFLVGRFSGTVNFASTVLSSGSGILAPNSGFVAKYDSDGTLLWAVKSGGNQCNRVAADSSGNAYVIGNFYGTAQFPGGIIVTSRGGQDLFVAKVSPSGQFQWVWGAGGPSDDYGSAVAVDGSGNVYLTGSFSASANFGSRQLTSTGAKDAFLVKLDSNRNLLWAAQAGGSYDDAGRYVAVAPSGQIYIVGDFKGQAAFGSLAVTSDADQNDIPTVDQFLALYDSNGLALRIKVTSGVDSDDYAGGLALDKLGNVFIAVSYGYTSQTLGDIALRKYDGNGIVLWTKTGGGSGDDYVNDLSVDDAGTRT